jgi:hypothetical protein
MSVFVPTGATVAVDPLDVLLVAPNGSNSTTLYLAQGQPVVVAALPAAVVAELNTAAGLVGPDTLFTTPVAASEWPSPVYIAGAQVKRVQPSGATNLGSMVLFALSGFMVTVPAVDLTAMMALINATTTGGGGGGGSVVPWAPVPTSPDASALSISFASATRIGNVVTVAVGVLGISTDTRAHLEVTVPLPLPAASPVAGCANGDPGGGVWGALQLATPGGANANFVFDGLAATPFGVLGIMQYTTP